MKWSPYALIALALAIAATSFGVLHWRSERARDLAQAHLAQARKQLDQLEADLRTVRQQRDEEHQRLLSLDTELGEAKTQLTAAEGRVVVLSRDLAEAKARPAADLASLQHELETLRATWLAPEKVAGYEAKVAALSQQLATRNAAAAQAGANATNSPEFDRERATWQQALAAHDQTEQALRTQIDTLTKDLTAARAAADHSPQLASAEETIADLRRQLAQLPPPAAPADDAEQQRRLATATARGDALAQQLSDAQQALATAAERERQSAERLAALDRALADARASAVPANTATQYQATIAALEKQVANLQGGRAVLPPSAPATAVFTSGPRSPSVVNVGPQNAFVVLNIGSAHGVREHQVLTICRGAETLARVLISDVREHFSIAQVEPDSLRGTLQKGDSALIAH